MKPENRQIFEENEKHWETLEKAGYLVHLSGRDRSNLVKAMNEEFQPGYTADLWCPTCVANMLRQVYRRYHQFVEQEKQQQELEKLLAEKTTVAVLDLKNAEVIRLGPPEPTTPPVQTKANFPSHKNRRR